MFVLPEKRKRSVCEKTHRHFDASGRLPADFHVEEHDWVGHDDDFDSKKKECDFFVTTSRRSFPLPEPKKCPDKKTHTRKQNTHKKMHKKSSSLQHVQKSSLQSNKKKRGKTHTLCVPLLSMLQSAAGCFSRALHRSGDHTIDSLLHNETMRPERFLFFSVIKPSG